MARLRRYFMSSVILCALAMIHSGAMGNTVQYELTAVDSFGSPITTIAVGSRFSLHGAVRDLRPVPQGIFSGYLDVHYDAQIVTPDTQSVNHFSHFLNGATAEFTSPGTISRLGGVDDLSPSGAGTFDLFSVEFQAIAPGIVKFTSDPSQGSRFATTAYGLNYRLEPDDMVFSNTSLTIVPEPSALILAWLMLPLLACGRSTS